MILERLDLNGGELRVGQFDGVLIFGIRLRRFGVFGIGAQPGIDACCRAAVPGCSADAENTKPAEPNAKDKNSIELSDLQLALVKVVPIEEHDFPAEKEAVGSIDFNQDMAVQVFTPYQGRIVCAVRPIGDDVRRGRPCSRSTAPTWCRQLDTDRCRRRTRANLAQPRAPPGPLPDAVHLAKGNRTGCFRPADRGGHCGPRVTPCACSARPTPTWIG